MQNIARYGKAGGVCFCVALAIFAACNRSDKSEVPSQETPATVSSTATQQAVDFESAPAGNIVTQSLRAKQISQTSVLDPAKDGWDSEVLGDAIKHQLELLLASQFGGPSSEQAGLPIAEGFTTAELRPTILRETKLLGGVVVRTGSVDPYSPSRSWEEAASALFKPLLDFGQPRVQVKIIGVQVDPDSLNQVASNCLLEVSSQDEHATIEQHMRWTCRWSVNAGASPKLQQLTVESFQESSSLGRWFADRTIEVVGDQRCYQDQLRHGLNYWLSRIEVTHGMYVFAEFGMAVGDVNGDGLEDVYVCQPGGLPNRLLIHQPDGTVVDTAEASGVNWLDHTSSALFVDFDNDGDQDLAIALESRRVILLSNDGAGTFQIAQELAIEDRHVQGLCAADFNNDSLVDLYLTVGFADERARPEESRAKFSYHDANDGGANVLFQNVIQDGNWRFTDVTRQVGLDQNNRRHSLAASWEDFDNDGDQDLYVANDYGQNCLYQNESGRFTDIAKAAQVVDFGSGMSVSWSDFDRDGWMDLYVGNMFSSAGSRIARQDSFRPGDDSNVRSVLARFAKGNTLFRNQQGNQFAEPAGADGVQLGRWAWSSPFADLNNDGWSDMLIANGYVTGEDERDL